MGSKRLGMVYEILQNDYSLSRDELPYRLETMFDILEIKFGAYGARSVGTSIARNLYAKLNLPFHEHESYRLQDYVEEALAKLNK